MDTLTLLLGFFALTLAFVEWQAGRQGVEKRDVALMGSLGGLCGVGAAVAAVFAAT